MGTQRNSNGEPSIFKGSDGRWHGWITVGTKANGRPDRRHRSAASRAEVAKKIRDLEVKRETGRVSAVGSDTVGAWLEHWLTNIAVRRVRPRTLESYESLIRMHLLPGIGKVRLDRLEPEHLERHYSNLLADGLAASTVLRVHRLLSRALKVAMQRGRTHRNVATLVDPPAQRQSEAASALDIHEARAVLAAAVGQRNAARWTVALSLGLRQSEALALQWKDIDPLNYSLSVRRTIHRVKGGGLVYEAPKTKRSERTLALPMPLVTALQEHKAAQLGERMLAGDDWQDEDLIFAQPNGRPIDKKTDYDNWCALLQRAGVRHVRLHDGRHTAATLLLSEGVHPRVVMELLGHSQMRTTMDIYSHVMPALAREAADRMGAILLTNPLSLPPANPEGAPSNLSNTTIIDSSGIVIDDVENGSGKIDDCNQVCNQTFPDDLASGSRPDEICGAEGTRTPDPHTASVVRYQLRHSPVTCPRKRPQDRGVTLHGARLGPNHPLLPRRPDGDERATRRRPIPPGLRGMRWSEQYWCVATPVYQGRNP
ncbi:MAG: Integrase [Jatrophihabitans sp.]|nr:Integrase [Jatrophihabitans sp.]